MCTIHIIYVIVYTYIAISYECLMHAMSVIFGTIKIKHSKACMQAVLHTFCFGNPPLYSDPISKIKFPDIVEEGASRFFRSPESVFLVLINTMLTNWYLIDAICIQYIM